MGTKRQRTFVVVDGRRTKRGERIVLDDDASMQAIADPLRRRLLELLAEPSSARELADAVERPVTSLYHHLDLLEEHGLISVADLRKEGRAVIRRYRRTSDRFESSGDVRITVEVPGGRRRGAVEPRVLRKVVVRGPADPGRIDALLRRLVRSAEGALDEEDATETWEITISVRPVRADDEGGEG